MLRWKLLCFSLCPLALDLSRGTTEKSMFPSSSFLPIRYLYTLMRTSLSLLQAKHSQLSQCDHLLLTRGNMVNITNAIRQIAILCD